jgi:hypothetical protein
MAGREMPARGGAMEAANTRHETVTEPNTATAVSKAFKEFSLSSSKRKSSRPWSRGEEWISLDINPDDLINGQRLSLPL